MHNTPTRQKTQTVAYADTQKKHNPQFIATQTPKNRNQNTPTKHQSIHTTRARLQTPTHTKTQKQTRAPSLTKTPNQGLPNNYSPKTDKNKNTKNRCPTTIPQKKNKEKEHHPAHGNHRTRSTALHYALHIPPSNPPPFSTLLASPYLFLALVPFPSLSVCECVAVL